MAPRRRAISPPSIPSTPATIRNSVDFPEPLAPTKPTFSPSSMVIETPSKSVRVPNDLRIFWMLRIDIARWLDPYGCPC